MQLTVTMALLSLKATINFFFLSSVDVISQMICFTLTIPNEIKIAIFGLSLNVLDTIKQKVRLMYDDSLDQFLSVLEAHQTRC